MPQLREAYEEFFSKAVELSNESEGFKGAFARAAEARNVDRYEWYTDLSILAKNTKNLMPKESKKLSRAINNAVIYNKVGSSLNGKGISTYYPYVSEEKIIPYLNYISDDEEKIQALKEKMQEINASSIEEFMILNEFAGTLNHNSTSDAQKNTYKDSYLFFLNKNI